MPRQRGSGRGAPAGTLTGTLARTLVCAFAGALVITLGVVLGACGRGAGRYEATAVVEIGPSHGSPAEIAWSQQFIAGQLKSLSLPATHQRVVAETNVLTRPDLQGTTPQELVGMLAGRVTVAPTRGGKLVNLRVTGDRSEIVDDLANALAEWLAASTLTALQERYAEQYPLVRTQLQERIAQAGMTIRLNEVKVRDTLASQEFESRAPSRERDEAQAALIAQEPTYKEFAAVLKDPERLLKTVRTHPVIVVDTEVVRLTEALQNAPEDERAACEEALDDRILAIIRGYVVRFEHRREDLVRYTNEIDAATEGLRRAAEVKATVDKFVEKIEVQKREKAAAMAEFEALDAGEPPQVSPIRIMKPAIEPR